ncbi:MAG: dienelactone hydrolase family protein [Rhodothermales bacterium]
MPTLQDGPPADEAGASAILIHGRGASASSMLHLAEAIDVSGVHYRAPEAPTRSWYPNSFLAPLEANEPGIENGLATIQSTIDALRDEGVDEHRIFLIGFSQGACLASEFVARHPRRYGGVVVLSGGLIGNVQRRDADPPDDKGFEYQGSLMDTPVFVGCSDVDAHVPVERVHKTAGVLGELGGDVDLRIYEGVGHTVNDDELKAVRQMLRTASDG